LETSISVDVTAGGIPASIDPRASGIAGFQFTLSYDPKILEVTGTDTKMLLATKKDALIYDLTPKIAQTPGTLVVAAADLSGGQNLTGRGVLARITFVAFGAGTSSLSISDMTVAASKDYEHPFQPIADAQIVVSGSCGS
jgi:hypothetical protein